MTGTGTVGWGVAGCGWVARDHALPGLAQVPGARVVALHDRSADALERVTAEVPRAVGHEVLRTGDLAEFLASPGLDAVYVATPNAAHREVVEAAAAAGKAVLVEKPLAATAGDARAVVAAAQHVLLGTAYDQRWHPAHVRLRELLPELGTVTAVRVVYCCWLPGDWTPDGLEHDNWRVDRARAGGGAAIDLAPHGLDLAGVLLGEDVEELHALTQTRVHGYAVDDGALLHGRTPGGVLVDLHVAYNTPDALPRRRLEVVGTRGLAVAVDTMGQTAGGRLTLHAPEPVDVPFGDGDPFAAQFAAFTAAVAGEAPWPYDPARDLRLHELLLEALA